MRLLFDENLSRRLPELLNQMADAATHVAHHGLLTHDDEDVWAFAAANGYAIVSKDSDFYFRSLARGHPPKVIWLRIGNAGTTEIAALMLRETAHIARFLSDESASILVLP